MTGGAISKDRRRWRGYAALLTLLAIIALAIWFMRADGSAQPKPRIGVLTSMPVFWPEGDIGQNLDGGSGPSLVHDRLSQSFDLVPVDNWKMVDKGQLKLLLLIQPRALAPAEFDQFDRWLRAGGGAVILADPALSWESSYPLGDSRRPLFTSMLSPIFTYWGLKLALPIEEDDGPSEFTDDGHDMVTRTPGLWEQVKLDGNCQIASNNIRASCDLGAGQVILLADADIVDPQYWHGASPILGGGDVSGNMNWLEEQLLRLSK